LIEAQGFEFRFGVNPIPKSCFWHTIYRTFKYLWIILWNEYYLI